MNKLTTALKALPASREKQLVPSIFKAMVFFDKKPESLDEMIAIGKQLVEHFPSMSKKEISEAMSKGMTGEYGRVYKLTMHEMCLWLRCYRDNKKPKDYERGDDN